MRSLEEARLRWQVTTSHAASLDSLKKSVKVDSDVSPCTSGLRSVCWKAFLLFQSTDVTSWSRALDDSRSAYTSLREHFLRYIENPNEVTSALDPLDDNQHSPWNTLRQDEEIRAEIFQDVERCMPEEPYFRRPETQRILLDVLFIFCKINQDVGYRQGMHELLAPILWVVEQDAIDGREGTIESTAGTDSLMKLALDPAYIEHDAFTLLSLVMRSAKSFYELGEPDKRQSTTGSGTPQQGVSPIVERSKRVHEVYLARLDPELAKHLIDIEILPQIFLIRWIRLLFGREFPFDDLLALWDTLLAEDPGLDLIDMVCVAMLLRIRWQLLEANYSFALMLLLKYPSPIAPNGPYTFVDDAIFLRDNFSVAGGVTIISKYSGKSPAISSSDSRPTTPLGQSPGHKRAISRTKSPVPSPARFLQQQGGVEAILQGAAKGVFERGERLGINQAVRDAVGEAKKQMQGLQTARNSPRRTSDVMRWSLDEGRPIPNPRASITAILARNQQLARMLEQAMDDLRIASMSPEGDKEKYVQAMDLAIAKVDFVKVYLEDSTMPLPDLHPAPPMSDPLMAVSALQPAAEIPSKVGALEPSTSSTKNPDTQATSETVTTESTNLNPVPVVARKTDTLPDQQTSTEKAESLLTPRPKAPVPTRSTIAQSSFSWMLEPDIPSSSSVQSSPPSSISPFLKSGRRPTSGPSREKAAFLFGDDGGEPTSRPSLLEDSEGVFNMGTMKASKAKS
ncbi:hypothetical protein WAI453_001068 [Rhynchosporium graminicola]|uniref:Related to TBC1 domain family member 5 n=1 Tax=Rhynchosporium graminicola TaxID=2792576 RepID=A0A1E1K6M3_9HELO|nr:related to TBC1 domain family member 5 [Rhynchosporium commune]